MNTTDLSLLIEAVKTGKRKDAKAVTEQALAENTSPQAVLDALKTGMDDVGLRFKANEIFVPEVLVAARAMKTSMELLEPVLAASGITAEFRVVIGTVEGDLHDIGKNLVAMMLKGSGFEVIDLGTNVSAAAFAEAVKTHNAQLVGLSALLTTTMPAMRGTVELLKAEGIAVKIMVGGAPITDAFAKEIGADGYSADAASAVDLARSLVEVAA
ncbi:MAG: corrinoid protein [Verrucomicrobia bacterium]|nr:corrinoid protein [Verrucomicrobiota bacterium]MCH8525842.1 corrinoid protein [Kiritimatiellia bacterium]